MTIEEAVASLVRYSLDHGFFTPYEATYSRNRLLSVLGLGTMVEPKEVPEDVSGAFETLASYGKEKGLLDNSPFSRQRFLSRVMDCFLPRPDSVIQIFYSLYQEQGATAALDWYFRFSRDALLIPSPDDELIVTSIGKEKFTFVQIPGEDIFSPYRENKQVSPSFFSKDIEGLAGKEGTPSFETTRLIPLNLQGRSFFLSPDFQRMYLDHFYVLSGKEEEERIDESQIALLVDFAKKFPDTHIASMADIPGFGNPDLGQNLLEGFRHEVPLDKAPVLYSFPFADSEVEISVLDWPLSVLRLKAKTGEEIIAASQKILSGFRIYANPALSLSPFGDDLSPRHSFFPVLHYQDRVFVLDILFLAEEKAQKARLPLSLLSALGIFLLPAKKDGEKILPEEEKECLLPLADNAVFPKGEEGKQILLGFLDSLSL
jgi:UDPglucose--hexose-1-phosphate uridylyltransferase